MRTGRTLSDIRIEVLSLLKNDLLFCVGRINDYGLFGGLVGHEVGVVVALSPGWKPLVNFDRFSSRFSKAVVNIRSKMSTSHEDDR